ncbi:MAG: cytochrome c biogenesis protein CcsA [Desulfosudis oleivorans]|nr:cytochrome c biogenesis protein CcsA [Desulfosudis oleivorans]
MSITAAFILYTLTGLGFIAYLFVRADALLLALKILYGLSIAAHALSFSTLWRASGQLPVATPMRSPQHAHPLLIGGIHAPGVQKKDRHPRSLLPAGRLHRACLHRPFPAGGHGGPAGSTPHLVRAAHPERHRRGGVLRSRRHRLRRIPHSRADHPERLHPPEAVPTAPLTLLDGILYGSLALGFFSITAGMILGGLWASAVGIALASIAPKVLAGALMWLVFGLSLHQRFALGWKGRRTAIITLLGFILMVLLFVGINLRPSLNRTESGSSDGKNLLHQHQPPERTRWTSGSGSGWSPPSSRASSGRTPRLLRSIPATGPRSTGPAWKSRRSGSCSERSPGCEESSIEGACEFFAGEEAIRHLFMVASGLDSLVLGETQILGQMKDAYRQALAAGTTDTILNKALHRAFRAAKRIRTETGIGTYSVSVASEAVELAEHIFGDIGGSTVLVVGAGDMADIAARRLRDRGVEAPAHREQDPRCSMPACG